MRRLTKAHNHFKMHLAGLAVGVLVGSVTVSAQAMAGDCAAGEHVRMLDPVVIVIDGPGDPVAEQERWSNLANSHLEGPLSVALGETMFDLETVP